MLAEAENIGYLIPALNHFWCFRAAEDKERSNYRSLGGAEWAG